MKRLDYPVSQKYTERFFLIFPSRILKMHICRPAKITVYKSLLPRNSHFWAHIKKLSIHRVIDRYSNSAWNLTYNWWWAIRCALGGCLVQRRDNSLGKIIAEGLYSRQSISICMRMQRVRPLIFTVKSVSREICFEISYQMDVISEFKDWKHPI